MSNTSITSTVATMLEGIWWKSTGTLRKKRESRPRGKWAFCIKAVSSTMLFSGCISWIVSPSFCSIAGCSGWYFTKLTYWTSCWFGFVTTGTAYKIQCSIFSPSFKFINKSRWMGIVFVKSPKPDLFSPDTQTRFVFVIKKHAPIRFLSVNMKLSGRSSWNVFYRVFTFQIANWFRIFKAEHTL